MEAAVNVGIVVCLIAWATALYWAWKTMEGK